MIKAIKHNVHINVSNCQRNMLVWVLYVIVCNEYQSFKLNSVSACTLRGDKVSMLSHIYPHKSLRKIELTICNHQADSLLYVWPNRSDLVICNFRKSMVIHDTECPYWDQVSLNSTKPNQTKMCQPAWCPHHWREANREVHFLMLKLSPWFQKCGKWMIFHPI